MPSKIVITYLPESTPSGLVFAPKIPIWISTKNKHSYLFHALIDSGADVNLFPARLAEVVGINFKEGEKAHVYGIGRHKMVAYENDISLHLANKKFETTVYFSYEQDTPLLGRQGFFNLFKRVDFDENKHKVTLHIK